MLDKPPSCVGCPLFGKGKGFSKPNGKLTHRVLILAEALGEEEEEAGFPLVGASGRLVSRMIERTRDPESGELLKREDFLCYNVIACRPPENELTGAPWEEGALAQCRQHWQALIETHKPRVILALGNQALRALTGLWGVTGSKKQPALRGYAFKSPYGIVVPTYHPAYIMRGKFSLVKVWQHDLLKALQIARHGLVEKPKNYITKPALRDLASFYTKWVSAGKPPLSIDIETPFADEKDEKEMADLDVDEFDEASNPSYTIIKLGLCFEPLSAISCDWAQPFLPLLRKILSEAPTLLVWNRNFDIPRLIWNGCDIPGEVLDVMDLWHFLEPGLPKGLKFAGGLLCPDMHMWKLDAHKDLAWYNSADVDVTLRSYLSLKERALKEGKWEAFLLHFVELFKVLEKMRKRGIPSSREKRKEGRDRFQSEFEEACREVDSLVPLPLKNKKVFKLSEERLRKSGSWEEGAMVQVIEKEKPKPPKPIKEKKEGKKRKKKEQELQPE